MGGGGRRQDWGEPAIELIELRGEVDNGVEVTEDCAVNEGVGGTVRVWGGLLDVAEVD